MGKSYSRTLTGGHGGGAGGPARRVLACPIEQVFVRYPPWRTMFVTMW